MASEFDLIRRLFTRPAPQAVLGVGDDAALIAPSPGHDIAISTDMLVAGTHFLADTDPFRLGWKTLAVNLSDMAAMGAQPRWATLALALPEADEPWLAAFAEGFFACASAFDTDLIGGDTTRGPLALSVTIFGETPRDMALRRTGAKPGDDIWVSGSLGGAALALAVLQQRVMLDADHLAPCRTLLEQPQPRVELGLALRGIASAAIDISDGLLADLGHILTGSGTGATLALAHIPAHDSLSNITDTSLKHRCLLAGGDDYELCFTAPPAARARIERLSGAPITRIGEITAEPALRLLDAAGQVVPFEATGYEHFA